MALTRQRQMLIRKGGAERQGLGASDMAVTGYQRLYTVNFEHGFYNRDNMRCPDFQVLPTPTTTTLMRSLGVQMQDFGTGFVVSIVSGQQQNLLSYLAEQSKMNTGWARLSFALVCTHPGFVGFTELPLTTNPSHTNFYLSNQMAHPSMGTNLLTPGPQVDASLELPLIPQTFDINAAADIAWIEVTSRSGEVAMEIPGPGSMSPPGGQGPISVDFIGQPDGYYEITEITVDGDRKPAFPCLRTLAQPKPMLFIDLLFCAPEPDDTGLYAVTMTQEGDGAQGTVQAVDLVLRFAARSTIWTYYVTQQTSDGRLTNLAIAGDDATFAPGPMVRLPTGEMATPFTSDRPLTLRQKSPYRFHLKGSREGRFMSNEISMAYLPVAPASPVWPGAGGSLSEIYLYV